MNEITTAARLRVDRVNRGKSIEAFAAEIGVKPHVLKYAERGGRPQPESAKVIADFYETKVTDLWPVEERSAA